MRDSNLNEPVLRAGSATNEPAAEPSPVEVRKLRRWQGITLAILTLGYAGYYFCRANLSVAGPLLMDPSSGLGLDKEALGSIVSVGVLVYAFGKLLTGALCDFVGGRLMFVLGMVCSAIACIWFGMSEGIIALTAAWGANRLFQSAGWGALVKIASRWFEPQRMGTVMGILALSYLFGDALAKLALGAGVSAGWSWSSVFFVSSLVLGAIAVVSWFLLHGSPGEVGAPEPRAAEANVFGAKGELARPDGLWALLRPLFTSPSFLLVCVMSFGLTVIRETFNFWTPTFLSEVAGLDQGRAASFSATFPFFGGISILLAGYLSDRFASGRRGAVMVAFLSAAVAGLFGLSLCGPEQPAWIAVALISAVGLAMIGPYAFLSGAIAVDLGGKAGSSTAAGVADAVGYFGSVASGWGVGKLAQSRGWSWAFAALTALAVLTLAAALIYWRTHERQRPFPSKS